MISRRTIGILIGLWTLVSWGGRIGLLSGADRADWWSWTRIAGSLAIGAVGAFVLISGRPARATVVLFSMWTIAIWGRSLIGVWTEPNSTGFRIVHTGLAIVWLALIAAAVRSTQRTEATSGRDAATSPGAMIRARRSTTSSMDR